MDNIINFPSHIIEKEKELSRIEFDLSCDRMILQKEINKIQHYKIRNRSNMMIAFSTGVIVAGIIFTLMYA
jgi:hypothetical protein